MRDIRFRFWDSSHKKMSEPWELFAIQFAPPLKLTYEQNELLIPMQFTGLEDKNGVDIFEGDLVRVPNVEINIDEPSVTHDIMEVRYIQGNAAFCVDYCDARWIRITEFLFEVYYQEEIEVIGNIYENPELMEDTWAESVKKLEEDGSVNCCLCGTEGFVKDMLMIDGKGLCFLCKTRIRVLT